MNYFVTAIDTDSGKTLASSILCEAFEYNYWKPIQSGLPRDSDTVSKLISNNKTKVFPEAYLLNTPVSPHASAKIDGIEINLNKIALPECDRPIVVEGAGGCLVPINQNDFVIDIALKLNTEIILVSDLYLGSINHTLLTCELLRQRKAKVKGIIFNGQPNPESEQIILRHSGYKCLLRILKEEVVTKETVLKYAQQLRAHGI